ncbi:hypothetical protein Tco_0526079 [Tanacetum coccineum]
MYGYSIGASHYQYQEEEEPFRYLEEIEAQTIGNLLPNDDDLLSGVTDGLDCKLIGVISSQELIELLSSGLEAKEPLGQVFRPLTQKEWPWF